MITGMSYGALSYNAKVALARGAREAGGSTTTGDGGLLPAERENSRVLIYEVLPSRYGINVHHLRQADAIELTIGQGAKPGTGGLLLGSKGSAEIAHIRHLPPGVDQRSPARHPDFLGPDDMIIKIEELREATDWQVPIFVKLGAARVYDDVKLAAKAGAYIISPFVGRLDDIGYTGMDLIRTITQIYRNYGYKTQVLAASLRSPIHVIESALAGAHIGTMPFKVLDQLFNHPLTDKGLEQFLKDWGKVFHEAPVAG